MGNSCITHRRQSGQKRAKVETGPTHPKTEVKDPVRRAPESSDQGKKCYVPLYPIEELLGGPPSRKTKAKEDDIQGVAGAVGPSVGAPRPPPPPPPGVA